MSTGLAIAGLVFSVYQYSESRDAQARARREAKDAREAQQAATIAQNRRERQQSIERARRRRAAVIAQSQAQGALRSSPVQGALGSLQSQTTANVSFQNKLSKLAQFQQSRLDRAAGAQSRAASARAAAQIPGQLGFSNTQTFSDLLDGFNTTNTFQGVGANIPRNTG